jgi:hypothetical protein
VEARVDKLLTNLGLLEEEQYGFTKEGGTSTAICTVASAIEDARVRDKETWIEFKDQEKAFGTLEAFQGKVIHVWFWESQFELLRDGFDLIHP